MSIDTNLYLPPQARLDTFTDVLSALLGATVQSSEFSTGNSFYASVKPRLEVSPTSMPEMARIDGSVNDCRVYMTWHWEDSQGPIPGGRTVITGYREERRPVFEALADFFGGVLDMNDCDDTEVDYVGTLYDKPYQLHAGDGAGWEALQRAILAVEPITTPEGWNHSR